MSPEKKISIQGKKALSGNMTSAVGGFFFISLAIMLLVYGIYLIFTLGNFALLKLESTLPFAKEIRNSFTYASYALVPIAVCFGLVLLSPLFLGLIRFYYLLAKGKSPNFSEVFRYVGKGYSHALYLCVTVILRCFLRILLPLIPAFVSLISLYFVTLELESLAFYHVIWYGISYVLIFAGFLGATALCQKYFLCCFIFFEDENLEIDEILNRSKEYIAPFRGTTLKLMLPLRPCILSCILIIPAVFVIPYVLTCLSISAKWLLKLKFESKDD